MKYVKATVEGAYSLWTKVQKIPDTTYDYKRDTANVIIFLFALYVRTDQKAMIFCKIIAFWLSLKTENIK